MRRDNRRRRRGVSAVQTALIFGFIAVAVAVGVQSLGVATRDDLTQSAGEVADPSSLVDRWSGGNSESEETGY